MSFNFPSSPVENQVFVAVADGITFIFKNGVWMRSSDDAPVDGKTYGRNNLEWVEVASNTFPDSPYDTNAYGRKNNAWVDVTEEAPSDSTPKARLNGTWTTVISISDTAPLGPTNGQLWWNSLNGNLYISYNDGTSTQWVQINMVGT